MRNLKKYIGLMLATVVAAISMPACQDDFDAPGMNVPVATLVPNTTIAQVKADYWNSADNYIDTIKVAANDEHVIIAGRVISSDASGNIYKSLVIQDRTGALAMSINANSLYVKYRVGQEVVIDLTDMYIGKYSTLQQLGFPDYSASYGWQATFMPLEFFQEHAQLNGLPDIAKVDTLELQLGDLGNSTDALQKYQSQLVRFNNVYFEEGGEASFCTAHQENTNRTLKDDNGNTIIVRTSGYANFWSTKLPAEHGDVVGILSTYNQSGTITWQLLLRSTDDLLNFGSPTLPRGTETNPYDVADAIDMVANGNPRSAWYTGYIVGSISAGVTDVTDASQIVWGTDAETVNTLVIGQTAESNTLDDCMLLTLPQGSDLREYGNLIDHPENYQKQIWVLATPGENMGMKAFTGNTGSSSEFRIEGVNIGGSSSGSAIATGDGSEATPYNPTQVVGMGTSANVANVWVKGYIVGWVDNSVQSTYADENNCVFTTPATVATNILLATTPGETDYSKCCVVNLPTTDNIRAALNLVDNPSNFGKVVSVYGTIRKYFAIPGVRDLTAYKLEGGSTPDTPVTGDAVTSIDQNFEAGTTIPAGWSNVAVDGNANWFIRTYGGNNSAEVTAYNKTAGTSGFESWLISPALNVDGMTNKTLSFSSMVGYTGNGTLEVFVLNGSNPSTATATKLNANIPAPTGTWSDWVESGSLSLAGFSGTVYIGFRYKAATGANYTTYRVDNIVAGGSNGGGGGGETPDTPDQPSGANSVDFSIFGGKSTTYSDRSADGWTATWAVIAIGGADNPNAGQYSFLGDASTTAVVLDGSPARMGVLTSPSLAGGISKLSFNYAFAFGDKKAQFTVNIKQNGSVVASKTETIETITKNEVYTFSMDCNVKGAFVIEVTNNAYSQSSSNNSDRVAIWNMKWDN